MAEGVLAGRNALVTGGAQGLGGNGSGARRGRREGDDRRRPGRPRRDRRRDSAGRSTALDVTDEASWEAAVAATIEQLGGLDILVNNAGIEISGLIVDVRARRTSAHARGQRPRHRARHQARPSHDAARRRGRQRRRDRQRLLGRGDDRLPRHQRLLGDQVGRRPAHAGRRVRGRQARLSACASTASTRAWSPRRWG